MAAHYRPEIDGLRALAVIGVMLYHVGVPGVSGGFLGVDMFFVISGFLITQLVVEESAAGRFTLRRFYLRRARRLLPALLAVIGIALLVGCVLLGPLNLKSAAASAMAANVSLSNVMFFRESGYFDADAITKPLLHTWSLAVEEQFYFVWPVLLSLCIVRWGRRSALLLAGMAGLASLILVYRYRTHTSAIFFLTPFRAFEFAIGAVLVWCARWQPRTGWMAEGLLAVGFVLIGVALVGSSEELSFSDVNTLLPCIGTALAIHAGRARLLGAVLRHPLAVGIGLISYSLYLVHWPLIVLVKYNHFEPFSAVERLALLAAAVALATALYHGIEKPLRARDRSSADARTDRRFVAGCASATMGVSAVALGVWFDGGLLHRYPLPVREQLRPEHMLSHRDYTWPRFTRLEHTFNAGPQRKVLVVGDSQAADFVNLLGESGVLDQVDVQAVRLDRQCQSLISLSRREFDALGAQDQATCSAYFARWIELRDLARADVAVLAFNWYERGLPSIEAAVVALTARGVRQVVIVGRKSQGYSGFDVLQQRGTGAAAQAFSAHHRNAIAWRVNEQLQALPRHFEWVDTMTPICPSADVCHVFDETGRVLFFDSSHLTPAGARFLGQRLRDSGALDAIAPRHAGGATAARS